MVRFPLPQFLYRWHDASKVYELGFSCAFFFFLYLPFVSLSFFFRLFQNWLILQIEFLDRAPEIDISELESLFSSASASDGTAKGGGRLGSKINKPEKVQLVSNKCFSFNFLRKLLQKLISKYAKFLLDKI